MISSILNTNTRSLEYLYYFFDPLYICIQIQLLLPLKYLYYFFDPLNTYITSLSP